MKIYSEVGLGTTMKIYLPRDDGASETAQQLKDESVPRGSASELVLLVEDDASVRKVHTRMLEELGYTVLAVDGPIAALQVIDERLDVKLLFTDIVMAPMNGRKLAEEIWSKRPGLPVVFTTGYSRNAVIHNGLLDDGVIFLQKPAALGDLARKVRMGLDRRPK
jgi:CheY-like chemotaxis protein